MIQPLPSAGTSADTLKTYAPFPLAVYFKHTELPTHESIQLALTALTEISLLAAQHPDELESRQAFETIRLLYLSLAKYQASLS